MVKKLVGRSLFFIISITLICYESTRAQPDILWTKTFGGSDIDEGWSVQQTSDGGFIVAGFTKSFGAGDSDVWLIKVDRNGNEDWNNTFGGQNSDVGFSVMQTMDGGYIIAGHTYSYGAGGSDVWLIKVDEEGNEEWNRTFGESGNDGASEVQQTADGGYVIVGGSWLYKTHVDGDLQWKQLIYDANFSVVQTGDGGYIVTGYRYNELGNTDVRLLKTDEKGNEVWNRTFGGNRNDRGLSVKHTMDGGYIIAGTTESFSAGESDVWLIKTDANGNEVWNRVFGGAGYDEGNSVQQTKDGGYIVAGRTSSFGAGIYDVWLIKVDAEGNEEWNRTIGENTSEDGYSVYQAADGGYIVTGRIGYLSFDKDVFLVRISSDSSVISVESDKNEIPSEFSLSQNYPNPFNSSTTIQFSLPRLSYVTLNVYNTLGEEVAVLAGKNFAPGNHKVEWNANNFAGGVYFYRLQADQFFETKKLILLK